MYDARVRSTTWPGSGGGSVSRRCQPASGESSQSRTICLSNERCGRPGRHWPAGQKPGRVRCQHLVSEQEPALGIEAELNLRVGHEQACLPGDGGAAPVHLQGDALQLVGEVGADRGGDGGN